MIDLSAEQAAKLYKGLRTDELLDLQRAHELDQAEATSATSIAFSGGRLALIAAELKRRAAILQAIRERR